MKLAFIFLAALVVVTHQHFQRSRGMLWLSPYSPGPVASNYHQPLYYDSIKEDIPFYRHLSQAMPIIDTSNEEMVYQAPSGFESPTILAHDYDAINRYYNQPSSLNQQAQGRFFFYRPNNNNNANNINNNDNFYNPFFKTATFTSTSTVTVATVTTCVPSTQLVAGYTNCRRRRHIAEPSSEAEDAQFSITPSHIQEVVPTTLPSFDEMLERESRQLARSYHHEIDSSKETLSPDAHVRRKRFFGNYFIVSTTLTSYLFVPTTITKVVTLGGPASVSCLPFGYGIC